MSGSLCPEEDAANTGDLLHVSTDLSVFATSDHPNLCLLAPSFAGLDDARTMGESLDR
jgi:hypothetical protein